MKIEIENNNKIKNSNIGENNIIGKENEKNFLKKYIIEIIVGVVIAVISGFIIFILNWNWGIKYEDRFYYRYKYY